MLHIKELREVINETKKRNTNVYTHSTIPPISLPNKPYPGPFLCHSPLNHPHSPTTLSLPPLPPTPPILLSSNSH